MCERVVCDKVVCERFVCERVVWQSCVWKVRVTKLCVTCICDKVVWKISVRHQSQSSAISATPATRSGGRYREVPGLPRKVTVDVAKCHACHANSGGAHGAKREPSAPPEPAQYHNSTPATQSGGRCRQDSPSATPATQSDDLGCEVPHLPRKQRRRPRR